MSFFDAHPALTAALCACVCTAVLGWFVLRALKAQNRRSVSYLRRMEQRLSQADGSFKSGMRTVFTAMNGAANSLTSVSDSMEARQERMRRDMDSKLDALRQTTERRLDEMTGKLGSDMQQALETRIGESFRLVSGQLESVYKGLGEMRLLAHDVGDLKRVLTNVKTRGVWGEIRLKSLLESDLPRGSWLENACVKPGSQERVEIAVRMPGKDAENPVLLPIDSKFPAEDHQRLISAREKGAADEIKKSQKALEAAFSEQAKRISLKYINPPLTTDFALMFLPTEGLYAELLSVEGLTERLQSVYHVLPVGPSNLSALLSCLQMGFRTLAVEKRSGEIMNMLGDVRREFASYADTIQKARVRLEQAAGELDSVSSRTRTLNRKLGEMEKLPEAEVDSSAQADEEEIF